jgi:hypothetical protein
MARPPAWQGTHPIATANTFLEASWRLLTHRQYKERSETTVRSPYGCALDQEG